MEKERNLVIRGAQAQCAVKDVFPKARCCQEADWHRPIVRRYRVYDSGSLRKRRPLGPQTGSRATAWIEAEKKIARCVK